MFNNKKGEGQVAIFFSVAVAVIVGLVLFAGGGSSGQIASVTQTVNVANQTFASFAAAGIAPTGRAVSSVIVTNSTGGETVPASNYTVANNVINSQGVLSASITPTSDSAYKNKGVNVSYTYEPVTYDENAGNRAVVDLVLVFFALAIAFVAFQAAAPYLRDLVGY